MGTPAGPVVRGMGSSVVGHWVRDRSLRVAAGLAVAVAIPVAVLFYFQFRSIADLGRSSAVVLRQISEEASEGLGKSIEDGLKAPYLNVLLRTGQQQTEPLNLPLIATTLEQGLATVPYIGRFYVWSDAADEHRGEVLAYDRTSHEFVSGVPEGDRLVRRFRELSQEKRAIAVFEAEIDGRHTYFQAQLRFNFPARDKLTSFVALSVDAEDLRTEYFPNLVAAMAGWCSPAEAPPPRTSWTSGPSRWCSSTRNW